MADQDLILYTYHGIREGVAAGGTFAGSDPIDNSDHSALYDGRQGELIISASALPEFFVRAPVAQTAESDVIDTVILSGNNFSGADIRVQGIPSITTLLAAQTIPEANREPIRVTLTASVDPTDNQMQVTILNTGPQGSTIHEMSELFLTTAHVLQLPETGWNHGYRPALQRFESQSGVSSTWLLGRARKLYRFTWERLTGASLAILENLQAETDDFTAPFWLQPPDDAFPLVLVEIDRDADWRQMFEAPLQEGLGHRVTLPLVEVIA